MDNRKFFEIHVWILLDMLLILAEAIENIPDVQGYLVT